MGSADMQFQLQPHRFLPSIEVDPYCGACGHPAEDSRHVLTVPERANREGDSQGLPTPNAERDIQSVVQQLIEERKQLGIRRYGTALQPFNGRDALKDLQEELLDALMYTTQKLVERDRSLADHDHTECREAVVHALRESQSNGVQSASKFLELLAEKGYVLIKQEHL